MRCRRVADAAGTQLSSCQYLRGAQNNTARQHRSGARLLSSSSARPTTLRCRDQRRPAPCAREPRRWLWNEVDGKLRLQDETFRVDNSNRPVADPPEHLPLAPNVAVLGGGITGLTTAYYLAQTLPPRAKITVYEGDKRVGGWIRSEHVDTGDGEKKLFERGPRMISMAEMGGRYDRMVVYDLLMNLGLPTTVGHSNHLQRWIWHENQLVKVPPNSFADFLRTNLWVEIGPTVLFHYLLNFQFRRKKFFEDVSIADWAESVLGSSKVADTLVSAFVHGIWGGDARKLSAMSVLGDSFYKYMINPKPRDPESLMIPFAERHFIRNFLENRRYLIDAFITKDARQISLGSAGIEALPQALADSLRSDPKVELQLGNPVKHLSFQRGKNKVLVHHAKGRPEQYDKVISTLPAHQLDSITEDKLPTLRQLDSVSIMTVNLWYPEENLVPKGLGYLIPAARTEAENPEKALGVFFDSQCGIGATIDGPEMKTEPTLERGTKVFVLLGGHYYQKTPERPTQEEAISLAKGLLQRQLGIPRDTPCYATARYADKCLPQHYTGHRHRMAELSKELQFGFGGRLAVAGGSFGRPGVSAGARAGWEIAYRTAGVDFLCDGLSSYTEDMFGWCETGPGVEDVSNYSAMRSKKKS